MGEVKNEEQSRTFKFPHCSQVAPQARLKVQPQLSKAPQSKGLRPFSTPPSFPTSLHTPPTSIPKFPKRGILKTYKKLLERPSQFEKVHKVLDENYFWKIFRIKKRKARNTPPVRACFQIFITNDFIKF